MEILRRIRDSFYVIGVMFMMLVYVVLMMLSTLWNVIVHGEYEIELRRDGVYGKKRGTSNNSSNSND